MSTTVKQYSLNKAKLPKSIRRITMNINKRVISKQELHNLNLFKNEYLLELQKSASPTSMKVRTEVIERVAKRQKTAKKHMPSISTIRRWECNLPINDRQFSRTNQQVQKMNNSTRTLTKEGTKNV